MYVCVCFFLGLIYVHVCVFVCVCLVPDVVTFPQCAESLESELALLHLHGSPVRKPLDDNVVCDLPFSGILLRHLSSITRGIEIPNKVVGCPSHGYCLVCVVCFSHSSHFMS